MFRDIFHEKLSKYENEETALLNYFVCEEEGDNLEKNNGIFEEDEDQITLKQDKSNDEEGQSQFQTWSLDMKNEIKKDASEIAQHWRNKKN